MKKRVLPLVLAGVLLLSSCSDVSENRAVVLLYDVSASTAAKRNKTSNDVTDQMRAGYLPASREIISKSGPGTTLYGGSISDRSLRVTTVPIAGDFPRFRPLWDNQLIFKTDLLKRKQEVLDQIGKTVNYERRSDSTCIIDSLLLAQQFFGSSNAENRVLVLFSDMIEDCGAIDFDKTPRPGTVDLPQSEAQINKLIDELQKQQKVPDLKGVKVCIYGATGGQAEDDSSSRYIWSQNFWKAFFARAGASVTNYGPFVRYPFASQSAANVELPPDTEPQAHSQAHNNPVKF